MVTIARSRRLLPTFVALAVAAFLVIPMITNARVVNAQSAENDRPCEDVPQSDFEDRNQAAPAHRESIDCVDHHGITSGSGSQGQFYVPLGRVDRAQMATFIVNTLEAAGLESRLPSGDRPDEFDDISDSPHRGNINKLARIGVVRGTGGGDYSPNDFVDRDAMATFLLQAYEWAYQEDYETSDSYFGDVPPSNPHFGNINAAYEEELVRGVEEPDNTPNSGRYNPNGDVLRQAMASFLVNLLGALNGAPDDFCASASPTSTASASPTSGGGGGLPIPPIIGGDSESPSASPSSTASPTASSTARPTSSASASPSPCASQSGNPSPSPSGSASPTSTARPTGSASPTPTSTASEEPCPIGLPIC